MRPMPWPELRLAAAELAARKAMAAELEQAKRDAVKVRELARLRCTVRPSRWLDSEREAWARHQAVQGSLRALARESAEQRHVGHDPGSALSCRACQPRRGTHAQGTRPA